MKKRRGFTLIEFMVAAVIFSLFTFTLYNLFAGGLRAYKKGETLTLLKKNISSFLDWVSTDFHAAVKNSVSTGSNTLTLGRYIKGSSTSLGDYHSITYTYSSTDGTITREDTPSTTTYSEEGDIKFGGDENIYFFSTSNSTPGQYDVNGTPFTYDSSTETLAVNVYAQYEKVFSNDDKVNKRYWKQMNFNNTFALRIQGQAFDTTDTNYATKVMNGNDAIEDPGSPPDRIKFLK